MKGLAKIFGAISGFITGFFITHEVLGGGIGGAIGYVFLGYIENSIGTKAVNEEIKALGGASRSVVKAVLWWFVLLLIAFVAIISLGLISS